MKHFEEILGGMRGKRGNLSGKNSSCRASGRNLQLRVYNNDISFIVVVLIITGGHTNLHAPAKRHHR